ncbi:MAG: hypothetical protein DWG76_07980, partial [Chloroflexi bacterium]|nr:hypothetical protein [Chloroflexota bacterium]
MVYSPSHSHYLQFEKTTEGRYNSNLNSGIEILKVIEGELEGGWVFSIKGLVTAEVFADYLQMADSLLDGGYQDAAAVIAGSTLEGNLRTLCKNASIDVERLDSKGRMVPVPAGQLNAELAKSGIYNGLVQKQVTGWLDLRNKAAHGHYG